MITASAVRGAVVTLSGLLAKRFMKGYAGGKVDSLASFTRSTRIEPIALLEESLAHQTYIKDVIQVANSTFTGYYLQGLALYNTSVNGVKVLDVLGALNPNRDVSDSVATYIGSNYSNGSPNLLSFESYRYKLPVPGEKCSMEAVPTAARSMDNTEKKDTPDVMHVSGKPYGAVKDISKVKLEEAVNLSVGRMFEVTLKQGADEFKVPVMVRTIVSIVKNDVLAHILGTGGKNNSFKERYWAWRSGQIEFIRDIILMQDLIDAHKKNLLKDNSGVYSEIMKRRRGNTVSGMISGVPSIGSASNIVIVSKRTVREIERETNGRFSDVAFRNRIFKNTYMLLLFVVDDENERVTIYHRDIALPTELSVKEMLASSKSGSDPMEIMKAYMAGQTVRY